MVSWLLLQLSDSAFPAGGFSHSNGFEAALQHGEIRDLAAFRRWLNEALWQLGNGSLPLASAAHALPATLGEIDRLCDAFTSNHVSNRASRVQGRAFLATCERSFATAPLLELGARARVEGLCLHYAPVFGAVLRTLEVERAMMQRLFLYCSLRGMISAAVRLGIFGPYQGQRLQAEFGATLDRVLARCSGLGPDDLAQTAPLLDLYQATHDRLYSKLFQS